MVLNTIISGLMSKAMEEPKGLKPVPMGKVYNQELSVSNLNLSSGAYAPAAPSQFNISGIERSNVENENIRIVYDTNTGLYRFKNNASKDWIRASGTLVAQPSEPRRVLEALAYQGYDTVDVSGGQ